MNLAHYNHVFKYKRSLTTIKLFMETILGGGKIAPKKKDNTKITIISKDWGIEEVNLKDLDILYLIKVDDSLKTDDFGGKIAPKRSSFKQTMIDFALGVVYWVTFTAIVLFITC